MKRELIGKVLAILIIGMMLISMTTTVFAADEQDDFWSSTEFEGEEPGKAPTDEDETKTEGNNYDTELPDAGAAENVVFGVAVLGLSIVAVCTYNKMKYYKNI